MSSATADPPSAEEAGPPPTGPTDRVDPFVHAPCGYAICDAEGLIVEANPELLRLVGRSAADVVGRYTLAGLVSVGGRMFFDTHLFPMLELHGSVREVALEVVRADGSRVPVLLNANVSRGADGRIESIRAVVLAAEHRRQYESDLLEAVRATEEARRTAAELARSLQQTLIPPTPPAIPGLRVAAAYRPAGDGSEVGGDFYDVFQVAAREWVIVLGDVLGKGVAAATVTAFVRHTVRELAMQTPDPAQLLARLDDALNVHPTDKFCTLVVLRVVDTATGWTVTGSVGGHPLPLARAHDGVVRPIGSYGSLVGILEAASFESFTHPLADDVVVLFTDGVTEARRGNELFGEQRLSELVAATPGDADDLTQAIVQAALAFQGGDAIDDMAVVCFQRSR